MSIFDGITIPKPPGIYFFYTPPEYDPSKNWVHRILHWPRKYADWILYIHELRTPIRLGVSSAIPVPPSPPYIPNTIPDPWFHRTEAADMLEAWFQKNQWIRWQMRRIQMHIRKRIMDCRIIGETDVGTLERIPDQYAAIVYDWPSRSKYRFHVNTIHENFIASLRYTSIAISLPKCPKNPYTNLEWTLGQQWVLLDQVQRSFWNMGHRFIDPVIQVYSNVAFSIPKLRAAFGRQMDIDCARRFFHDPTSEYWEISKRFWDSVVREQHDHLYISHLPAQSCASW